MALFLAALLIFSGLSLLPTPFVEARRSNIKKQSDTTIHVKFKDDSGIKLLGNQFVSEANQDLSALNAVLPERKVQRRERLFKEDENTLDKRRNELRQKSGRKLSDLNKYYKIKVNPNELESTVQDLKKLPYVEHAYAQPLAAPAPAARLSAVAPAPAACLTGATICETFASGAGNFTATSGAWSVSNQRYNVTSPVDGGFGKLGPKATHKTAISGDYDIHVDATLVNTSSVWNDFGVIFGYQNDSNYNFVSFGESNDDGLSGIFRVVNGQATQVADITRLITASQTYTVKVQVRGATVTAFLNGQQATAASVQNTAGKVGFGTRNDPANFDDLSVAPVTPAEEPVPAATPDYASQQAYLKAAPTGVGIGDAASIPGATGSKTKIVDIEYSWNLGHEDLSKARGAATLIKNGTPNDPFNDNNHGTAVLGELIGDKNGKGVTGIAHGAELGLVNVHNTERGWDMANAVYLAVEYMNAGDVMLIEQQTWGPTPDTYDYVPVEFIPEVYDAIKYATSKGIIVVEAGGNGGQNLDNTTYYGTKFPQGKEDSGAIIVGAGENCANVMSSAAPARSRLASSNYGSRIDMQGPGNCVVSSGYGDLFGSSQGNTAYTKTFNGTSSASPVVAAAAATVSSAYEQAKATAATPAQVRAALRATGSAQNTTPGSLTGNIGPLPNIKAAIDNLLQSPVQSEPTPQPDTQAPTAPTIAQALINVRNTPYFRWNASTDNVGVTGYRIDRTRSGSSEKITFNADSATLQWNDMTTGKNITYYYRIYALDAAGNVSPSSALITLKTRP